MGERGLSNICSKGGGEYLDHQKHNARSRKESAMERKSLTPTFRKQLKEVYGTKCKICGEDGAEYHHLIPVWMGGEDTIENFIPVCRWHHMLMHKARSMRMEHKGGGRRRSVACVDGYKYIINDYLHCMIGTAECKKALGLTEKTGLSDRVWFREYIKELGIAKYRNNVDILRRKKATYGHADKDIVGWIEYTDGRREEFDRSSLRTPI